MMRIFRSPRAEFGETDSPADAAGADGVYDDETLRAIAGAGFNAVWVRVIFRRLLADPEFPSFGAGSAGLLAGLNNVIERGARHGVGLVLYTQEPFGMERDDPFWREHPGMAGADCGYDYGTAGGSWFMRAFCTGSGRTRDWLRRSSEGLLRALPGIAAVVTITASEFMSHCYSQTAPNLSKGRASPLACPRCRERHPTDIVVEVLRCMREGMDRADPRVPLIAWNWSWRFYEDDPQPSILSRLPAGVDIMADFERGGVKRDPGGGEREIDEYALSYAGPSRRFLSIREAALASGRRVHAKLQLSTTHEIASVSNLPLIGSLFEKASAIRGMDLAGFLGCWNFGNRLSLNTRAFDFFLSPQCPDTKEAALRALSRREFPAADAERVAAAWGAFGEAFDSYPHSHPFLYYAPVNYCLALPMTPRPLRAKPIGRSWLMDPRDDRDDPAKSLAPFSAEEIVLRLERMGALWGRGLHLLEEGLAGVESAGSREELAAARAIHCSLRSAANYYRLYLLKRDLPKAGGSGGSPEVPRRLFEPIARDEAEVLEAAIPVYARDPRQGYHGEAHAHMVTPDLMRAKLADLRACLAEGK